MTEFRMPSLGADMEEATLVEWLVKPGDQVHRGDIIAVVDTVKAAMDVEVFTDGWIEQLLVKPGTTIAVGTPIATIAGGAPAPEAPKAPEVPAVPAVPEVHEVPAVPKVLVPAPAPAPAPVMPSPHVQSPLVRRLAEAKHVDLARVHATGPEATVTRADVEAAAARRGVRASPLARKRAGQLGIDLATVTGTGADGAITEADVVHAAGAVPEPVPVAVPAPERAKAASRASAMREATAALMARSKREIPHFYLTADIDMRAALAQLDRLNADRPVEERLIPSAFLLKAAAVAAKQLPEINGFWGEGGFVPAEHVHLGIAISLRQGGLIAPAIHDADQLSTDELMRQLRDLVARSRAGRLRRSEMADPTITVTNLGELGVDAVYGVIYPPQVAVVGFGRVIDRAWAVDGMLTVRPIVTATLSADHRALDGHRAGRYLTRIDELLGRPEEL